MLTDDLKFFSVACYKPVSKCSFRLVTALMISVFFLVLTPGFANSNITGDRDYKPSFRALAFFTARNDRAHISFVKEANKWFSEAAKKNRFTYDTTSDWSRMTELILSKYQLV